MTAGQKGAKLPLTGARAQKSELLWKQHQSQQTPAAFQPLQGPGQATPDVSSSSVFAQLYPAIELKNIPILRRKLRSCTLYFTFISRFQDALGEIQGAITSIHETITEVESLSHQYAGHGIRGPFGLLIMYAFQYLIITRISS